MDRSYLIITDSGGVQEEGPSFRVPIIVTRDTTERPEAVEAGAVVLVGTNEEKLFEVAQKLLTNKEYYLSHTVDENPYGDGTASGQIIQVLLNRFLAPT
jgi:UDP-N-acetylglucosamine 2-epimerase (non-hydrolysing)